MVAMGTVLLLWPAIWNGFPLMYSDTGAYLATAFEGKVPLGRPTGYGLFIRYTSLGGNVWLPLVAQSLLFAGLLWRLIRVLAPLGYRWGYLLALAVVMGFMGMPWYSSQLMPDAFTGLVVLGFFLLLWDGELGWVGRLMTGFLLYWFCFSHYSHAALLMGLVGLMGAVLAVQRLRKRRLPFGWGRLVGALLPALLAVLTFYWVNYSSGFGWRMTRSSHVFTMARLSETGLLRAYLHETCAEKHWVLCPYVDSLPVTAADFIWSDASPFKKTGYWEASRPGYDSLLADFFSRPSYVKGYAKEALKAWLLQMKAWSVGEGITPYNESSSPYKFFERAMPDYVPAYLASRQFDHAFSFDTETWLLKCTIMVAAVVALVLGLWKRNRLSSSLGWFAMISLAGYMWNAFLTGALANVYARLQTRIAWLIPLAACLMIAAFIRKRQK